MCVLLPRCTLYFYFCYKCVCVCVLHITGDWGGNAHSTTLELAQGTRHIIWLANPHANEGILGEGVSARWSCVGQVRRLQKGECVRVFFCEAETEMHFFYTFSHVAAGFGPLLAWQSKRSRMRRSHALRGMCFLTLFLTTWREWKKESKEQSVQLLSAAPDMIKPYITCTVSTLSTQVSSWTVHAPYPLTLEPISALVICWIACFCGCGFLCFLF